MSHYYSWNDEDVVWREFYKNPSWMMDCAIEDNMVKWVKSFYVMGDADFTCYDFKYACRYNNHLEMMKFIYKVVKIPQYSLGEGIYSIFRHHGKNTTKEIIKETKINIHNLFKTASQLKIGWDIDCAVEFMKFLWNLAKENPKIGKIKLHENEEEIFINACDDSYDDIGKIKWLIHIGKTDPYADGPITQYRRGFIKACSHGKSYIAKYLWKLNQKSIKEYNFQKLFMDVCFRNIYCIAKWMMKKKCIKKVDCKDFATHIFKYSHRKGRDIMAKLIYEMSKNGLVSDPICKHDLSDEELKFYNELEDHYK